MTNRNCCIAPKSRVSDANGSQQQPSAQLAGPSCVRWVPTSELELYNAEVAILGPIRPIISQRMIAGLNTIATVHPKVRNGVEVPMFTPMSSGEEASSSVSGEGDSNTSSKVALSPLNVDAYTSIICVHGFAGGVANWLPVWRAFAAANDVYAFDLPGFARSERPRGVRGSASAEASLEWFLGYFERWFEAMGIGLESNEDRGVRPASRRVVLMGHSFGGYLCSMFAARHPHIADALILADSWGIPRFRVPSAAAGSTDGPSSVQSQSKSNSSNKRNNSGAQQAAAAPAAKAEEESAEAREYAFWTSWKVRFFGALFRNFGAGGLLRLCGPSGRGMVQRLRPDFADRWAAVLEDPADFYAYTYHCNAAPGRVGERGFVALGVTPKHPHLPLLDELPRAFAAAHQAAAASPPRRAVPSTSPYTMDIDAPLPSRRQDEGSSAPAPLAPSLDAEANGPSSFADLSPGASVVPPSAAAAPLTSPTTSRTQSQPPSQRRRRLAKVAVLFGASSWMISDDVPRLVARLEAVGADCSIGIVADAGHQIMSDNPAEFARQALAAL